MFETELDRMSKNHYGRSFIWLTRPEQKSVMEAIHKQSNIQAIQPQAEEILQKAESGNQLARNKILGLVNDTLWLQKNQEQFKHPRGIRPCL